MELLKLKHDLVYLSLDSEESMCVIMNIVARNTVFYYSKNVSISLM